MFEKLNLTDAEKESETVFSVMLERQHDEPSEKNLDSLFATMKDAYVYVPMHFSFAPSEIEKLKTSRDLSKIDMNKVKYSPMFLQNNQTGEKVLAIYSRYAEFASDETISKLPFMRMKVEQIVKISDKMPDAFDFVFDFHTHPVKLTIDELLTGLGIEEEESAVEE